MLLLSVRVDSYKGNYATEWATWEKKLRDTFFANAEHLNSIQVSNVAHSQFSIVLCTFRFKL